MCSTAINFFSHIYIKKKYIQKKGENVPIFGFHKMKWTFDNCTNYHLIKDAGQVIISVLINDNLL